jgi:hypothetical protein
MGLNLKFIKMSWDRTPLVVREKILSNIHHYPSYLLNCDELANAIVKTFSYVLSERIQHHSQPRYPIMNLEFLNDGQQHKGKLLVQFPLDQIFFLQHKYGVAKDLQQLFKVQFVNHFVSLPGRPVKTTLMSAGRLKNPPFIKFEVQGDYAVCTTKGGGFTHYKIDWPNLTAKVMAFRLPE